MADIVDSNQFGNPYFSLTMRKIPNGSLVDDASLSVIETLEDRSILSRKVNEDPITIQVENLTVNLTLPEVYSNKIEERE